MAPQDQGRPTLISIQYVRALASIIVVGWHSGFSYTVLGQAGVDLFFVVSGFVMMLVSGRERSPARFALARLLRIVPLYWTLTLGVALVTRSPTDALLSSLLFWPNRPFPIVIQGWSLNLEMMYYLLFALALAVPGRRLPILAALMALLCFVVPAALPPGQVVAAFTDPIALEFLAGACLFELWRRDVLPVGGAAWVMGLAGLFVLAATHLLGGAPAGWLRVAFWGVPCFAMVAAGLGIERAGQLPRLWLLERLGDASYSIYLTHMVAIALVRELLRPLWAPLALGLIVVLACLVGFAVYRLFELPIHRATSAAMRRMRPPVPAG